MAGLGVTIAVLLLLLFTLSALLVAVTAVARIRTAKLKVYEGRPLYKLTDMPVSVYVCMHACMYVCMHTYVCMYE